MNAFKLMTLPLAAALLAACGSSGPDPEPVTPPVVSNEVPASAYASTQAYVGYAATLVSSESAEPLDVDKVVPPTSETDEPREI